MKVHYHTFRRLFPLTLRDTATTLVILFFASLICFLLRTISTTDSHVPLIFVLAVLLISLLTNGYAYGLLASVVSVFGVNYAFTYPYFQFNFSITGYPLTFIVSFAVSIITSTLTTRVRQSEQVRIEAETEKMRANLLRAISHDFRTPLTGIIGSINVVTEDDGRLSDAEKRDLLSSARSDAEWLINVVENLLSITRIGSTTVLHKELQAVEEIVEEAAVKFRRQYPKEPLTISVPQELLLVPMDATLIEQVIFNLLNNAVLHGQTVTQIRLTVRREEDCAVFSVEDNGIGISPELLPQLFKNALPHRPSTEDASRGMGIGLNVCSAIVQAHGGKMAARNRPEGGACVSFALPLGTNAGQPIIEAEDK